MAARLIILLHGLGGSGSTMSPLKVAWQSSLPGARFVAPDAKHPYLHGGHQWFGVDGIELRPDRINSARKAFDQVVSEEIHRSGFNDRLDDVAFVGVSQGAIMALDAVASGRWHIGALVSFAGLLAPGKVSTSARTTPILLVHGAADPTIPYAASQAADARLSAAGFAVSTHILPGVGHTISVDGLELARRFLIKALRI